MRQPEELVSEVGAIAGAVNIPLGELAGRMEELPEKDVVFVCLVGGRSMKAVVLALQAGVDKPRHLAGGMIAWNSEFEKT